MQAHQESVRILRQSMTRYIRELSEELLYWTEELQKLENAAGPAPTGLACVIPLKKQIPRWVARRAVPGGGEDAAG